MVTSTQLDRGEIIEKLLANHEILRSAGRVLKKVTAEGFSFASDEKLAMLLRVQEEEIKTISNRPRGQDAS
jgi:hypothetical protein